MMQHHLHLKCLLSLLQIFSFSACHFIAPGYLKKWCWISYCRNISTAKGKLPTFLALLGYGFNYLSNSLGYSREMLSFYAFDNPLFLISKQWDWFDWSGVFISRAWWSPEWEGCLYSSGRAQSDPADMQEGNVKPQSLLFHLKYETHIGLHICMKHRLTLAYPLGLRIR